MSRRAATAAAVLAAVSLTAGCDVSRLDHLQFAQDKRLSFTSPAARSYVTTPTVKVAWTMKDFTSGATGDGTTSGKFGIFVDTPPIAPGQNVTAVAKGDESCTHTPGCPSPTYLAQKGVYVVDATQFTLPQLPENAPTEGSKAHHEVTVVLLDGKGVRHNESQWYVDFTAPKSDQT